MVLDILKSTPCLRSGFCCKQGVCPFGEWDALKKQCAFLEGDRPGNYQCGKYAEIIAHPESEFSPAFGAGCCSSMNADRLKIKNIKQYAER